VGYLSAAQELCRRYGVVFILDEIQTGLGRTGRLFASEKEQLEPDIMLLSKALGGGLVPLGVCLSTPEVWNDVYGRLHSSTFSNNNLTCAIGLAVIERLLADDRSILYQISKKGQYLLDKVLEIQSRWPGVIKEVRGEGLLVGIEFADFSSADSWDMIFLSKQGGFCPLLSGFLLNVYGIRCAPFLNSPMTIRLEPPLTIEYLEIDAMLEALDRICEIVYLKDYAQLFRFLVGDNRRPRGAADYRQQTLREVRFSQLKPQEKPTRKFAFLVHYPGTSDLVNATPSFEQWNEAELENFLEWQSKEPKPEVICHLPAVRSHSGEVAEGWLIAVPCGAKQMMSRPRHEMVEVIQRAVDLAVELGAQIVGLGAYTSVVSRGGRDVQGRGAAITSGNSYTIAMAVEALIKGAEKMRIDLEAAHGAVVGATGSIGRVCAILLSERVSHLNLIGNPAHKVSSMRRLRTVADDIIRHCWKHRESKEHRGIVGWLDGAVSRLSSLHNEEAAELLRQLLQSLAGLEELRPCSVVEKIAKFMNEAPPITVTVDLKKGMRTADLIITSSNSTGFLVTSDCLKSGAVLCDVSRPPDVLPTVREQRKDVLIIDGGLVRLPDQIAFNSNLGCRAGVSLACLSETMILALEGECRDYSIGSRIPIEDVERLRRMGEKHGFGLAALHSFGREITDEDIADIINHGHRMTQASIS
ncbi:MAG: aminotransferase class III-fold pyridoxal phosphate-dependent enzyme, partial [Syntrophomonadaceae bacterium]|nr:aminotransferase class III-fold pyridoxal phosphate-dependent enzyme [Syntrophomonadaceae bacterium]